MRVIDMGLGGFTVILAALQNCFAPSKRKSDFQERLDLLQDDLSTLKAHMHDLVKEVSFFMISVGAPGKISLRQISANGVNQLVWQFHDIRSPSWKNGRDGPLQILMPLEALDPVKRSMINRVIENSEEFLVRGLANHERARLSLNFQAKSLSYITKNIESQVKFRGTSL